MSLALDSILMAAIEADTAIMNIIDGRRWTTAAAMPQEDFEMNINVPYLIVNYDGLTSSPGTKDNSFDSGDDNVTVSITIAALSSAQLADLSARVRRAVNNYFNANQGNDGIPYSAQFAAGPKSYNERKNSFNIDLTWQCAIDFNFNPSDYEQEI